MLSPSSGDKVYHGILLELNRIVEEDGLRPGDKLPSERELSDRLKVGRSSVREALRALELLGLITTRRGEGTFIQNYRDNKFFDILGYYLLRDKKTSKDLFEMRMLLELDAVRLACQRATEKSLFEMEQTIIRAKKKLSEGLIPVEEDYDFHRAVARASKNSILRRIWIPLIEYSRTARDASAPKGGKIDYSKMIQEHEEILEAIRGKNTEEAEARMRENLENELLN